MKLKLLQLIISLALLSSCASVPKESVILSQTLGNDLLVLHQSHKSTAKVYFDKVTYDVNSFVDDVYTPFVIHHVLSAEYEAYESGEESIYKTMELAAQKEDKVVANMVIEEMSEFQEAARYQIEKKRKELISPIRKQESEVLNYIDKAYENAIYANATLTGHLNSIRKVKETQQEALEIIGLGGVDSIITQGLVDLSHNIGEALEVGKEIDVKSDEAYEQLEKLSTEIKVILNNK